VPSRRSIRSRRRPGARTAKARRSERPRRAPINRGIGATRRRDVPGGAWIPGAGDRRAVRAIRVSGVDRAASGSRPPGRPAGEGKRPAMNARVQFPVNTGARRAVHDVIRSPGRGLDARTRSFMEWRFGHDFGNVRVHTGTLAEESAGAVGALAYTVGANVVF